MKNLMMKKWVVFILAILGICCAFLLDYFYRKFNISHEVYKSLAEPLFDLSLSLFTVSTFLFFVREEVFIKWRNFAIVWLPITIFLVAISPSTSADFQIIDKEFVAIVLSLLFTIISLILIASKSYQLRGKK